MATTKTTRVTFNQGVLESQETTKVPNGFLQTCVNWVPEPSGGVRVRPKWFQGSTTGNPATRKTRGIGMFQRYSAPGVVQTSASVKATGNGTPILSWPNPTQVGNTLLCFVAYANYTTVAQAPVQTPTGSWTTRANFSGNTQQQYAVLEIQNAAAQVGDVTPTILSGASSGSYVMWLVELSGVAVASFDTSGTATSTGATTIAPSATTSQASELVLAFDVGRRSGSSTAYTLSTSTANWTELAEDGQSVSLGGSNNYQEAALYWGTRTVTGAQTITITSTTAVNHAAILLCYKGWNSSGSVSDLVTYWLAANDNGSTFDIYGADRNTLSSATFSVLDAGVGTSGSSLVAFTAGLGATWYTNQTFSALRRYNGAASAVSGGPPGRCIAAHKDRLWVAGTAALPERLYFSQINDGQTWTGDGSSYFDIGQGDGEPIEDITPFLDGLLIGKRTKLFWLVGDNTSEFQLVQLNAGGAAPGRSLLATPYGAVIAGLEQVWLFDGSSVSVIPMGRAIERSYGVTGNFVTMSYQDGSIYIADYAAEKIFAFDLNQGVWRIEKIGNTSAEAAAVLYNYSDTQLYGPNSSTNASLLNYRTFPGGTRGKDFDPLPEDFELQTGDLAPEGVRIPVTARQLYLQVRQRGGDFGDTGLTITPVFNGTDGEETDGVDVGAVEVRRVPVGGFPQSIHSRANTIGFRIEQSLATGEESCFDIEDAYLDYIAENPSV